MPRPELLSAARLLDEHRDRLIKLATGILGCPTLAEDVVNDAYIQLVRRQENSDLQISLAYLLTTVRNVALNARKKQLRERALLRPIDEVGNVETIRDPGINPEESVLQRDSTRAFYSSLHELPAPMRRAMRLYFVDQLNMRQVAEAMDLSVGKVHSLIRDGLARCESATRNE